MLAHLQSLGGCPFCPQAAGLAHRWSGVSGLLWYPSHPGVQLNERKPGLNLSCCGCDLREMKAVTRLVSMWLTTRSACKRKP